MFWDVNIEALDPLEYPEYTIFRILELGDRPEIWLRGNFSEEQIKDVIRSERRLSPLSQLPGGKVPAVGAIAEGA